MRSRDGGLAGIIASFAAALGLSDAPRTGYLENWGRGLKYRTGPLKLSKCDPSQHNTLRHDQIERRRKLKRRENRKAHGKYRRAAADI